MQVEFDLLIKPVTHSAEPAHDKHVEVGHAVLDEEELHWFNSLLCWVEAHTREKSSPAKIWSLCLNWG